MERIDSQPSSGQKNQPPQTPPIIMQAAPVPIRVSYVQFMRRHCRPSFVLVAVLYVVFITLTYKVLTGEEAAMTDRLKHLEKGDEFVLHHVVVEHRLQLPFAVDGDDESGVEEVIERPPMTDEVSDDSVVDRCRIQLVVGLPTAPVPSDPTAPLFLSTFATWLALIANANHTVDFYTDANRPRRLADNAIDWQRHSLVEALSEAQLSARHVAVRLIRSSSAPDAPPAFIAQVDNRTTMRDDDQLAMLQASVIIVDDRDAYVRATDGGETLRSDNLGLWLAGCPTLVGDLRRTLDINEPLLAQSGNQTERRRLRWNAWDEMDHLGFVADTTIAKRTTAAKQESLLVQTIREARQYVDIAWLNERGVATADEQRQWWRAIDEALLSHAPAEQGEEEADRGNVTLRILVSYDWLYDREAAGALGHHFLWQLKRRMAERPGWRAEIKRFALGTSLNRNQFVCTDRAVYIALGAAAPRGLHGLHFADASDERPQSRTQPTVRTQMRQLFDSYWSSPLARTVQTVVRRRIIRFEPRPGQKVVATSL